MTHKINSLTLLGGATIACVLFTLQGCSMAPLIGAKPSDPPPQIAYLGARDAKGNEHLTWQNVSSFGPVPTELKSAGDQRCKLLGAGLTALGYHPSAKDQTGKSIQGGGFFCAPTLMGN
jgi:hypothetical protein